MTSPDPEVPLVYTLQYAQQSCQDWEDELPPETMGRMKKQEKGKCNLHALSPRKLHPVLRAQRAEKDRLAAGQKNYFFGCLMNMILGVVK